MTRRKRRRSSRTRGIEAPEPSAARLSEPAPDRSATDDQIPPGFTNRRSWVLVLFALIFLVLFYSPSANRAWVTRVVYYYHQIPAQLRNMDPHERQLKHLGANFKILQEVDERLSEDDIFLLPPVGYVRREFDRTHWHWAEPEYFYYFLGRQKTVTFDSEDWRRATATVLLRPGRSFLFVDLREPGRYEAVRREFGATQP
jgi:hypothetical protein